MVHCLEALLLLRPLKERKFRNPDKTELVLIEEFKLPSELEPECAEHIEDDFVLVRRKEQKVAVLAAHRLD